MPIKNLKNKIKIYKMDKLKTKIGVLFVAMLAIGVTLPSVTAWDVVDVWGYDYIGSLPVEPVCVAVDAGCWSYDLSTWEGWIHGASVRTLTGVCIAATGVCMVQDWICNNAQIDAYHAKWWNPSPFRFIVLPRCP